MKNFPKEFQLLLLCASYFSDQEKFCDFKNKNDIDWQLFLSLLHRHRVLPMVCHNMHRWGIELPIKNDLKIASMEHSKKSLQQTALLLEINKLFNDNSIECIHFKGPTLSYLLYQDASLRQYKDIDILIERKNIDKALSILTKNKFNIESPIFKEKHLNNYYQKYLNDYIFDKHNCQLELHWSLFLSFSDDINKKFFSNTQEFLLHNKNIRIFNDYYYLSYLILHGYFSGWSRIHWLVDVFDFIKLKSIDFENVRTILKFLGHKKAIDELYALFYLFFQLEESIYKKPIKKLLKSSIQLTQIPVQEKPLSKYSLLLNYRQLMLTQPGFLKKIKYFKKVYATTCNDWKLLPLPKPLFFLYYLLRPILWFIRRVQR